MSIKRLIFIIYGPLLFNLLSMFHFVIYSFILKFYIYKVGRFLSETFISPYTETQIKNYKYKYKKEVYKKL